MALTKIKGAGVNISATEKLYFDDGGNTYIYESGADVLDVYVGGANMVKLTESTTDTVTVTGDLTVGVDGTGHDVKFFGDTGSAYMLWDQSANDLVLAGAAGLDIAGDIDVDGTTNLDAVDIDGALTQDGGNVVFNEDSGDYDFRVESNGNANMLFVDGGNDRVAIGHNSPDGTLHVHTATAGSVTAPSTADDLVIEGSTTPGVSILMPNNGVGRYGFGVVEDNDRAYMSYSHDAEKMFFGVGGADRMTITAGNVGIGTASPNLISYFTRALSIQSGSDSSSKRPAGLEIAGTASGTSDDVAYIELMGHEGDTRLVSLYATHEGAINSGKLIIATSNAGSIAEKLSVDKVGDVTVSAGDLIFGAAGKGVCLGVTSNTDANTLDDYEEGTWVGTFTDGSNDCTMHATYRNGYYTKVGNIVHISGYFQCASLGSASGNIHMKGLPFTNVNDTAGYAGMAVGQFGNGDMTTAGYSVLARTGINSTTLNLRRNDTTSGDTELQASELTASGEMILAGSYRVA